MSKQPTLIIPRGTMVFIEPQYGHQTWNNYRTKPVEELNGESYLIRDLHLEGATSWPEDRDLKKRIFYKSRVYTYFVLYDLNLRGKILNRALNLRTGVRSPLKLNCP